MRTSSHLFVGVLLVAALGIAGCGQQATPVETKEAFYSAPSEETKRDSKGSAAIPEAPKTPGQFKGKSITDWAAALKDKDHALRRETATELVTIDEASKPELVPLLLPMLKDNDADLRQMSAYVLGNICRPTPQVVSALESALQDADGTVRRSAATALIQVGRHDPAKVAPIVHAALKHKSPDVRSLAAHIRTNLPAIDKVAIAAKPDKPVAGDNDLEMFIGEWRTLSLVDDGDKLTSAELKERVITFDWNKFDIRDGMTIVESCTFKNDPYRNPKWHDVNTSDGVKLGIYKLLGDTLVICMAEVDEPRPEDFTAKPGSLRTLVRYQKIKKADGSKAGSSK